MVLTLGYGGGVREQGWSSHPGTGMVLTPGYRGGVRVQGGPHTWVQGWCESTGIVLTPGFRGSVRVQGWSSHPGTGVV